MSDSGTTIGATAEDLPVAVADALADPSPGHRIAVEAAGLRFSAIDWAPGRDVPAGVGEPLGPLLLIHGVTSSSRTWRRVGPALAAAGWHVVAPDLPGHGLTGSWRGRHRFIETAQDVAAFARAAGLIAADERSLGVVGHSWGSMIAAALPSAGLCPGRIVLLDPPALTLQDRQAMVADPTQRHVDSLEAAVAIVAAALPGLSPDEIAVKAETLTQFDESAALSIVLDNDWDGGLRALADPAASDLPVWVVRGEPACGGLLPDEAVPAIAARIGADHVLTIAEGSHSPQQTHPEATLAALLRALGTPS